MFAGFSEETCLFPGAQSHPSHSSPGLPRRTRQTNASLSGSTEGGGRPPGRRLAELTTTFLERTEDYLQECFALESPPRVSELANELGLARNRFSRLFRDFEGICPARYIKQRQFRTAKDLLRETALSVDQVGYRAGFGTRRTFFRSFRRASGLTPTKFRELCKMSLD